MHQAQLTMVILTVLVFNMKRIFILIASFFFVFSGSFGQKLDFGVNNVDFNYNSDKRKIEITYSIFNKNADERYSLQVDAFKKNGTKLRTNSLSGDLSFLNAGKHSLFWNPLDDNYRLDHDIYFDFTLAKSSKEVVPVGSHLIKSMLFPGFGDYRIKNGKHYFLYGLLGYAGVIGAIQYNNKAITAYNNYTSSLDPTLSDNYFNEAKSNQLISSILGLSAAAIWTVDLSSVLIRSQRVNKRINEPDFSKYYYNKSKQVFKGKSKVKHLNTKEDYMIAYEKSGALPPILKIKEITFSENVLDGEETAYLEVEVENVGPGNAVGTYVKLSSMAKGLSFNERTSFRTIENTHGTAKVRIPIRGTMDLPTSKATITIEVINDDFRINLKGKKLTFDTRAFRKPELNLVKYAAVESQSGNPNNQIDLNEMVDFKFALQNTGQGSAENIEIEVSTNQEGIMLMGKGIEENMGAKNQILKISKLEPGKYKSVTYRYYINSDFTDNAIKFFVNVSEQKGIFGIEEVKTFDINTELVEHGSIKKVKTDDDFVNAKIVIEDVPDFVVDVDMDIPENPTKFDYRYAIVIGNEDYTSRQSSLSEEVDVEYARNDARIFSDYLNKTLGFKEEHIFLLTDATKSEINREIDRLVKAAKYDKNAEIVFYYAGHGLPEDKSKNPYLIPVDGSASNIISEGISLKDLYTKLSSSNAKRITVFLDACFSGGGRNDGLLAARGVKIRPNEETSQGNMVVFASSTGEQKSLPYKDKNHGYFTYFLLKKLQDSKGSVKYGDLSEYLKNNVGKKSILEQGIEQTPNVKPSFVIEKDWENWSFVK